MAAARRTTGALLLVLCVAGASADQCTGGFSVVAPETAVPGTTSAVLVTLHGHGGSDETLNVTVRLEAQDDENRVKLLATATRAITGYGIVALKIPPAPPGVCTLHTTVGCAGVDECTRRSHSSLRLLGGVRDVVVRPARHHYRPGETVTFWVLALEHELRLVREELVDVALRDPRGTRVSVWDQLSLDEGVRKLSASLSPTAASGTWHLEARCGAVATSVPLHVSAATPARATSAPPVAEQHSVELRFADTMRRRYKPGLPFVGRVEAVSTERHVRVRVKLYDNETDIYSQDIDMASGEGGFVVPTVLADTPYLYLQAELVAVEGKEIETHYVLARERIKRWNSTARCYLLIDNLPTPLQAGSVGSASVWSSCGCAQRLLAAVTSGGRAVHWATISTAASASSHVTAPASTSASANRTVGDLCRFNYTFPVIADMAPTSSLLVYYVTDQGEPVSDVATIHVRLLHKEVGVSVEERRWWYPHAALQLRVRAPLDATLCLIGARAAGAGDAKRDQRTPWSDETHERTVPDEDTPEFVSAGVSLFVSGGGGACGVRGGGGVLYRQRRATGARASAPHDQLLGPDPSDRLWMWKCFNYTKELSSEGVTISAPSEAGRWSVWALSLSSRGLRFSEPTSITVFRPIQLEFSLPPALRVGETVELDVKITNNINNCMDVTALLALSAGAAFASTGMLYVTERLRLGPRGATQLVVRVAVNTPGHKNITVEVTGYSADNCSVSYGSFNNETLVGSVVRSAAVLVQPEGLLRSDTQSAYFCANEHLAVSTRSSWEWQWVSAPRNRAGLVLELRAKGPAHVALSSEQRATPDMYRVVIDGPRVWIARGKHGYDVHLASATQSGEDDECSGGWCAWWVWWEGGRLAVGRGARPHERPLLAWPLAPGAVVRYVGFSALWGDTADFRIWNFNEEAGFSQVLELALPHGVVPGSASGTLLVSGGLHLPVSVTRDQSIESSTDRARDSQLSAAAASLAPLLALEHTPHLVDDSKREEILKNLPEQIQTLLSFRNEDNSFSDHRAMSSHLSTIQILEILSKTQSYYPVDPELLQSIKKWVHSRQDPEGFFSPLPADATIEYYPEDIGDYYGDKNNVTKESLGWERNVEVTADTLATLLEIGVENEDDAAVVKKAQIYLERSLYNLTTPAALAFTVYALVLARSPAVSEALQILRNASTTEEGEFGWPSPGHDAADWLLEDSSRNIKQTSYGGARVEQYSATVRVLLAACARGALAEGEAAARYMYYRAPTLRAHPALAYPATKAAAQYAQLAHDRHRALTVSLATAGMELTDTIELRAQSAARLLQLPGLPTKVFVYATGAGCATVQGTITYSTYTARSDNALLSIQSAIIEEIRPERSSLEELQGTLPTLNIKTCFRWKNPQRSAVLRLEVSLFSGYELHSVSPVVLDGGVFADMQHGSRGHFVWFVFANVSSACPVCTTYQVRSHYVISGLRPAFAKIYPSNRPDLAAETFFHARPASSLLKGITDDDYITWFDKTEAASLSSNHSIDNICECGRICGHRDLDALSTTSTTEKRKTSTTSIPFNSNAPEIITKTVKKVFQEVALKNTTMMPKTKPFIKPIIYPTASYLNSTDDNQTLDNVLVPAIQRPQAGEIIVQKALLPPVKTVLKKEVKKKPLPRRKGTLKATYGDKHEFFFYKHQPEFTPLTIATKIAPTVAEPEMTTLKHKTTTSNDSFLVVRNNKLVSNILPHMLRQIATTMGRDDSETTVSPSSILSQEAASSTETDVVASTETVTPTEGMTSTKTPSSSTSNPTILEHSTSAHTETITTISNGLSTQSSQFTTTIPTTESESYIAATKTKKYFLKLNKSKQDDMTRDKYSIKPLKSINKEIHKIPPTPFSETSKTLSSVKEKLAPENRDGFVVLDKNELWELLKEEARSAGTGSAAVESNIHAETASQQKSARSL